MSTFSLSIFSPEKRILQDEQVSKVSIVSSEGEIQILPGHADYVGILETGVFHVYMDSGEVREGVISSGLIQFKDGRLTLLAETFEFKQEINVDRAHEAEKKAQDILSSGSLSQEDFRKYELKLQRALIRQQAVEK